MQKPPLTYEKILVRADRVELLVRVNAECFRKTTPALIQKCLVDFPLLPRHACRNKKGTTFGSVMNQTSVPHLLEHIIVYLQVQMLDSFFASNQAKQDFFDESDVVITGTTQWDQHDSFLAHVSVSFFDDIIALSACKKAMTYLNKVLWETYDGVR